MIAKGAALDVHAERILDDVALAAEMGLRQIRIDVPWKAAQPRAGSVDGDVFERVHAIALTARAAGLEPWFRLLQPAIPLWFDNEGGFTDERTAGAWWPRWVESVSDRLGDVAAGWVPFEAPYAMSNRLEPDDPRRHGELMHHLVIAWRDAWRILRGPLPVATSLDVAREQPENDSPLARMEAGRREQLRWGLWLQGFTDGIERIPGRADRDIADLQGSCSIIGLALRSDVETCMFRTVEHGLGLPIALTYRPTGDTDGDRATQIEAMWAEVGRVSDQAEVTSVTVTPFADTPGAPGVVTKDREVKDSGAAFTAAS